MMDILGGGASAAPAGDLIKDVTEETFMAEVVDASMEVPVIVDFWAPWCGPCKMIAPILEEIASEQMGSLRVAKVNVDEAPDLARRFEVMSIPTLILFDGGLPTKRLVGAKGKPQLLEELAGYL